MSTIKTHKKNGLLEVTITGHFNLWTKKLIESRIANDISQLSIDLSNCKFIDSEGVIFMYRWQSSGKELELVNPPDILFEIIDLLELNEHWGPNYIKK